MDNNFQYYCKDKYFTRFPKEIFEKLFYRTFGAKVQCASYVCHFQPFVHLSTSEPCLISPWIDTTRSRIAYGFWDIPLLLKNIQCDNKIISHQALNSLLDCLHNPEKARQAINNNIIARLLPLVGGMDDFLTQGALSCLRVLCSQPSAKTAILSNKCLLLILKKLICDKHPDVRFQAILTTYMLAQNWFAVYELVERGFIESVLKSLKMFNHPNIILRCLLEIVELLLDDGNKAREHALTLDCLNLITYLDNNDSKISSLAASVLSQLFRSDIGKLAAHHYQILEKLKDQIVKRETNYQAQYISALMFATLDPEIRKKAVHLTFLSELMNNLFKHDLPSDLELNIIKVLTNLAELPEVKATLRKYMGAIASLPREKSYIQKHIDILFETITWTP